jgi:hypothetical protein
MPPPSETINISTSSSSFVPPPPTSSNSSDFGSEELNEIYQKLGEDAKQKLNGLSYNEQISVLQKVADKKKENEPQEDSTLILNVEDLDKNIEDDDNNKESEKSSSKSETKSVKFNDNNASSSSSSETKQVKL